MIENRKFDQFLTKNHTDFFLILNLKFVITDPCCSLEARHFSITQLTVNQLTNLFSFERNQVIYQRRDMEWKWCRQRHRRFVEGSTDWISGYPDRNENALFDLSLRYAIFSRYSAMKYQASGLVVISLLCWLRPSRLVNLAISQRIVISRAIY